MARVRKSTRLMTEDDWQNFNEALNKLIRDGGYPGLVAPHSEGGPNGSTPRRMHGSMSGDVGFKRFLAWHRAYLILFENTLRKTHDTVTIPYWDWVNSEGIPRGLNHLPTRGVQRNTGIPDFTSREQIDQILLIENFDDFVFQLEVFPHNSGHNWIGGIMLNPMLSPFDPMFWLHHANVDRIWNKWQKIENNIKKKHSFEGAPKDEKLDPWGDEFTLSTINDISDLGEYSYEYAPATVSLES